MRRFREVILERVVPARAAARAAGITVSPGLADALVQGEQVYRARCFGCHQARGGTGTNLFRTTLGPARFKEVVTKGREGTTMAAFGGLLSIDEIWALYDFVLSRDSLE